MSTLIGALIFSAGLGVAVSAIYLLATATQPFGNEREKRDAAAEGFIIGAGVGLGICVFIAACRWSIYFAFGV